jgi:hypothetical protein
MTLRNTRPNDPISVVSSPVGEACQWAAKEIEKLSNALARVMEATSLEQAVNEASIALSISSTN